MGIEDIGDALVIRERATFLLTDPEGNVPTGNRRGFGIYHADTRHLSAYRLTFNGIQPVLLLSTAELGYAMEQVMTNPTLHGDQNIKRGTIELTRRRVVADVVEETLRLTNYNASPVTVNLLYEFSADFGDIFDVRGYDRARFGRARVPAVGPHSITYSYEGVDGTSRSTHIDFDRKPDYVDESTALFRVLLPPRQAKTLRIEIALDGQPRKRANRSRLEEVAEDYRLWIESCTQVSTNNNLFNHVLDRSLRDVRMLWSETAAGESYPAAGTPWFDAPFGRDSAVMSMQMLAFRPEIARNCLRLLAKWQGHRLDPARDEEPGKILHELRFDELTRAGELPYGPYYGSIDSTPLFLMLAAAYYEWTADDRLMRLLLPSIRAALEWMATYGDPLHDGYLSYEKQSRKGLVNQGWKDSWDAIVHTDGRLATAPIALAEAQAYAYAAQARLSPILDRLGEGKLADKTRRNARKLHRRFNDEFWNEDTGYFAFALDGERKQVATISSNPGHCLWGGLVDERRAESLVDRLIGEEMYSGWGIRTLTRENPRYNPIGYHVGTVWPHDNSIAAMGFKMYGFDEALNRVATSLFDASTSFAYFRLPELFGGDRRSPHGPPVPYPVACKPQSWAAGAFPLITQAMLGLKAEAPDGRLRIVRPTLPYWLDSVHVRGLRIGSGTVTLSYRRDGEHTRVEVQEATGGLDVVVSSRWPL